MTEPRTCISIPGLDGVKACFTQGARDHMVSRILFRIEGFNDQECKNCVRCKEQGPSGFQAWELVHAIEGVLERGIPLDLSRLPVDAMVRSFNTAFKRDVVSTLARTAPGKTLTYGELARRAGHPGAARAVGNVMRNNPFPIVIPCHRVVSSNGLGGFGGNEHPVQQEIKAYLQDLEKNLE